MLPIQTAAQSAGRTQWHRARKWLCKPSRALPGRAGVIRCPACVSGSQKNLLHRVLGHSGLGVFEEPRVFLNQGPEQSWPQCRRKCGPWLWPTHVCVCLCVCVVFTQGASRDILVSRNRGCGLGGLRHSPLHPVTCWGCLLSVGHPSW